MQPNKLKKFKRIVRMLPKTILYKIKTFIWKKAWDIYEHLYINTMQVEAWDSSCPNSYDDPRIVEILKYLGEDEFNIYQAKTGFLKKEEFRDILVKRSNIHYLRKDFYKYSSNFESLVKRYYRIALAHKK